MVTYIVSPIKLPILHSSYIVSMCPDTFVVYCAIATLQSSEDILIVSQVPIDYAYSLSSFTHLGSSVVAISQNYGFEMSIGQL